MARYVPDIVSRRWVIISPQRLVRPHARTASHKKCPFCVGNEKISAEEVYRIGKGTINEPGWLVRVIANKFPVTDIHEVIIHSPHHESDIDHLNLSQVELIVKTYRERYNQHKKKGQVIIFCNSGAEAGGSVAHPHSQLVVVPQQINLDTLSVEPLNNKVEENESFTAYCPDFSQWPYEVWIASRRQNTLFGDITDEEISVFAEMLQKILKKFKHIYREHKISEIPYGYNFYIYPKENWYMRVIPRFVYRAGFELGTGLSVNIVDPLDASLELRGIEQKVTSVLQKLQKYQVK